MNKKIIISFVVILVLGAVIYFAPLRKTDQNPNAQNNLQKFESAKLGLRFYYPQNYFLQEINQSTGERNQFSVVLAENTEENRRVFSGQEIGREGPPTITIGIYQNNLDHYTTEKWITGTSNSNFKLSDGKLESVTIDNQPALRYQASGLYENRNVVIARDNFVYMLTVNYLSPSDQIIKDYAALLKTVQFTNSPAAEAESLSNLIILDSPKPGEVITSPLTIKGKARGNWFFEATFPIVLTNWDGLIIAQHYATAKSDWMTTDFVPFEATLEFKNPTYNNRGSLILKKSNPSGLPEHDAALEIPISFNIK